MSILTIVFYEENLFINVDSDINEQAKMNIKSMFRPIIILHNSFNIKLRGTLQVRFQYS